jgi:hypothetical protein
VTGTLSVYRLLTDTERYCSFALADESKNGIYHAFDGRSHWSSWEPLVITAADESDDDAELADFALLGTIPMVSARAAEVLHEVTASTCELLPLVFARDTYFALNVLTVVDALDEERSRLTRFSDGAVMSVEDFVFVPKRLERALIFRIPQLLRAFVFVTPQLVDVVRTARLTGFRFKRVWQS